MSNVLVFGAFDGLHPGHMNFLAQAKNLGDRLVVALAQDAIIKELKGSFPEHDFETRKKALEKVSEVAAVIGGDAELSQYSCVMNSETDVIAFGYDQKELKQDVEKWLEGQKLDIKVAQLDAHQPEKYKSSILKKN